ncbi:MAG: NAD(P)H-dependent oxidoreductase [Chloroflexi bacterium]|nr:NAD(P)H-dependent oxidoreductase [Chloroflexota bacterium]
MARAIVVYDSRTGHTEKMALAIGEGLKTSGAETVVKKVDDTSLEDLMAADAIVVGSPTYFGNMSAKMKTFVDKTIKIYPDGLKDKFGAVFTSAGGVSDGCETALLTLILFLLYHRMVIVGVQKGAKVIGQHAGAFGAVSIRTPDEGCLESCYDFGQRIAGFIVKK